MLLAPALEVVVQPLMVQHEHNTGLELVDGVAQQAHPLLAVHPPTRVDHIPRRTHLLVHITPLLCGLCQPADQPLEQGGVLRGTGVAVVVDQRCRGCDPLLDGCGPLQLQCPDHARHSYGPLAHVQVDKQGPVAAPGRIVEQDLRHRALAHIRCPHHHGTGAGCLVLFCGCTALLQGHVCVDVGQHGRAVRHIRDPRRAPHLQPAATPREDPNLLAAERVGLCLRHFRPKHLGHAVHQGHGDGPVEAHLHTELMLLVQHPHPLLFLVLHYALWQPSLGAWVTAQGLAPHPNTQPDRTQRGGWPACLKQRGGPVKHVAELATSSLVASAGEETRQPEPSGFNLTLTDPCWCLWLRLATGGCVLLAN
eukprot:comp20797_c0_seq1/m.27356 comp20797_c0_seq1/g.27356  ORF comp20797_c0_seq1/g.27356 comp20797_c0_seq1/m.27356 type:complete len:365 (+) comp20797_c0_seq1:650-1744(+)